MAQFVLVLLRDDETTYVSKVRGPFPSKQAAIDVGKKTDPEVQDWYCDEWGRYCDGCDNPLFQVLPLSGVN